MVSYRLVILQDWKFQFGFAALSEDIFPLSILYQSVFINTLRMKTKSDSYIWFLPYCMVLNHSESEIMWMLLFADGITTKD